MLDDRLDLGCEYDATVFDQVIKRFDAKAVAIQGQLPILAVPDRDAEIAFDLVYKVVPAFFIKMNDRFGVGLGVILVASLFQMWPDVAVVVYLAVKSEQDITALATAHRLVAGG